jgi:hypothetical protein
MTEEGNANFYFTGDLFRCPAYVIMNDCKSLTRGQNFSWSLYTYCSAVSFNTAFFNLGPSETLVFGVISQELLKTLMKCGHILCCSHFYRLPSIIIFNYEYEVIFKNKYTIF